MILSDAVVVKAGAEAVFQFFEDMEGHYRAWHADHVLFRWEQGRGLREGNIFYFEESIGGKFLRKRVVFTRVRKYDVVEFAPTFWLMRLFLPRILFRIERRGAECLVTAELHLRIGPLAARLNRKELEAVREHMRVEGENLKRLVEAAS